MRRSIYILISLVSPLFVFAQKPILQWYNYENTSSNVGYQISSQRNALQVTRYSYLIYSYWESTSTLLNGNILSSKSVEHVDPCQDRYETIYLYDSSYYDLTFIPTQTRYELTYHKPNNDSIYSFAFNSLDESFGYVGNRLITTKKQRIDNNWIVNLRKYDENGIVEIQKEYTFKASDSNNGPRVTSYNPITITYANEILILNDRLEEKLKKVNESDKNYSILYSQFPLVVFQTGSTWQNQSDSIYQFDLISNQLISAERHDNSFTIWYGDDKLIYLFEKQNSPFKTYKVTTFAGETLYEPDTPYLKEVTPLSDGGLAEVCFDEHLYPNNKPSEIPAKIIKRGMDFSIEWFHSFTLHDSTYQRLQIAPGPEGSVYFLYNEQPYREPYFREIFEGNKYYYGQLSTKKEACPPIYLASTINGSEICDSTLYSRFWLAPKLDSQNLSDLNIDLTLQWYENGKPIEGATSFTLKYDSLNNHQFKLTQQGCETYSELINEPEPIHFEIVPDRPEIGCNVGDIINVQFKVNGEVIDPVKEYKGFTESPFRIQGTNLYSYYQPRTLDIQLQKNDNACLTAHEIFEITKKTPIPQPIYSLDSYGEIDLSDWNQSKEITGTAHFEVINPVNGYTYEWLRNDSLIGVSGPSMDAIFSGTYNVKASKDECFSKSQPLSLTLIPLANKNENPFIIYPNPSSDMLRVNWPKSIEAEVITIYDLTGKLVVLENIPANAGQTYEVYLKDLPRGNYIVRLASRSGILTEKFSKLD